jgi:hypothetical protein
MSADPARTTNAAEVLRRAQGMVELGKAGDAVALLERALAAQPRSPALLHAAGTILVDIGAGERAMVVADRLRALAPDAPASHLLAARAEESVRRFDAAAASLEKAHALRPDQPGPAALRARLAERANDLTTARHWVDLALRSSPQYPLGRLLDAKIRTRTGQTDEAVEILAALSADPAAMDQIAPAMRAAVYHELGQALDRSGHYDRAWRAFESASLARQKDPAWMAMNPATALARIEAARAVLDQGFLAGCPRARPGDPVRRIFLVGMPRSGTTLTEQVLGRHPAVVTTDEQSPLGAVIADLRRTHGDRYPACLRSATPAEVERLRLLYAREAVRLLGPAAAEPGRVVLDKLPLNLVELPLLARVFWDARLIVALRDPRDVCLSNATQHMAANPSMKALSTLEGAAQFADRLLGMWCDTKARLTMAWAESRYEGFVADPESGARALLDFCGLSWDDGVLDRGARSDTQSSPTIATPSYEAVAGAITTKAVERWRHYAPIIGQARWAGICRTLAPVMRRLGYQPD